MAIPFGSDIDLKNNKIKNAKVDTPSVEKDIANKEYVDGKLIQSKVEYYAVTKDTTRPSSLPSTYQQIDYLQSTGTQYIDTGIVLTQNHRVEISISDITSTANAKIFGSRTSATSNNFSILYTYSASNPALVLDFYNYNNNRLNQPINDLEDSSIIVAVIDNTKLKINEVEKEISTYSDFSTPANAYIFNGSGSYASGYIAASMKLHYCKIYENNVLIRDYIPCYRKEDNVSGLYDTIENIFYINAGTDSFLNGSDVTGGSFSTTIPILTSTNKYLWSYSITTYADGTTSKTEPVIIGVYGDTGNDVPVGAILDYDGDEIPDGYELVETTEDDTPTEDNTSSEPLVLTSSDDANRVYEEGKYLCYYGDLPSNLPVNSSGVLEVIKSGQVVDHCIQKYYVEESQATYERHISEELGAWTRLIHSGMYSVQIGTFTTPEADNDTLTGYVEISYPDGYTKDNCTVISLMSHNTTKSDYWSTYLYSQDSLSMILGNGDLAAIFKPDVIRIMINKASTTLASTTITYRLVLMRIDF